MQYQTTRILDYQVPSIYLIVGAIVIFAIVLLISTRTKPKTKIDMRVIDRMDGVEFERYFAKILLDNGFHSTKETPKSGDFGLDLISVKSGKTYGMQLKRYKITNKVSVSAIQEAIAGCKFYDVKIPCVVTCSYFTAPARKMAEKCNVILIDRDNFTNDNFSFKKAG